MKYPVFSALFSAILFAGCVKNPDPAPLNAFGDFSENLPRFYQGAYRVSIAKTGDNASLIGNGRSVEMEWAYWRVSRVYCTMTISINGVKSYRTGVYELRRTPSGNIVIKDWLAGWNTPNGIIIGAANGDQIEFTQRWPDGTSMQIVANKK